MTIKACFESPIGWITVERSNKGISRIDIHTARNTELSEADELLQQCREEIFEYLGGNRKTFSLPLDLGGLTGFQAAVLKLALEIPYGEVRTYGELANTLGKPAASRAVGGAMARNPLPLLIPLPPRYRSLRCAHWLLCRRRYRH